MTRKWMKGLIVIVLASPAALVSADEKESSERNVVNHDSKTKGDTTDWFDMARNDRSILTVPSLLNGTLELDPGDDEVFVNRTSRKATIEACKKIAFTTGTLNVEGEGLNWYPLAGKTKLLAPNANPPGMNRSTTLFPGTYAVEINANLRKTICLQ